MDVAEASSITQLDSCTVQVDPPMTAAMERLRLPDNLMKQLNIVADLTPTGLVLTGELNRVVGAEKCSSLLVPEDLQAFRFIFTGFRKLRSDSRQSDIKSRDRWIMQLCARIILCIIGDLAHNWASPA